MKPPVPVKKSEIFTTAADMQTSVTIHVFQGERPMSRDNTSLGEFNLDGLAPPRAESPKSKSPSTSMPAAFLT